MNKPESLSSATHAAAAPVFISYATADRKEALAVCNAIERRGTSCWISSRDVKPGENYQEAIVRAIRTSQAMVLVFSDAANNSDEIKKELSLASKHHVPLMALRIEDVEPSDAFAYELSTRQWIDAFDNWDRSVDALVETLHQIGAGRSRAAAAPAASPYRRARLGNRKWLFSGGVAAAALIAAGAAWYLLRPTAAGHTMQVRLAGFTRASSDVPATMPAALNDEIDAAFNDEGVIGVSTATAPPSGTAPAYAVGGSIRHDGDKVKLIVRLTDERSGTTLWSNTFSYDSTNLGHVPRWAAVEVSHVVRCGLFGASTYPKALPDPVLKDYLQFCGDESPTKGLDIAHRIVAAAPDFSWGWSALELSALGSAYRQPKGPKRDALLKEGIAAAEKAIALDPSNSEAYSTKSYLIAPDDLLGREALLKKGIGARPLACGCEHHLYANFLMEVGRVKDALSEYSRSMDVLPLNGGAQIGMAEAQLIGGDPDAAAKHFDAAVDLVDRPQLRDEISVMTAPLTGKYAGTDKVVLNPKFGIPTQDARALSDAFRALQSGNRQEKATAIAELNALPQDWIGRLEITLFGALDDNADAMTLTALAAQREVPGARAWLWYPSMDGVRHESGFPALVQHIGLMNYWKSTHTKPDVCSDKKAPQFCGMI